MKGRPNDFLPARGTHRRIQALAARGWPLPDLAAAAGMDRTTIHKVLAHEFVNPRHAAAFSRLYDALWDRHPPTITPEDRAGVTKALNHARRLGWAPPLAWDDIDLDDAPETPARDLTLVDDVAVALAVAGEPVDLSRPERVAAVRILHARGLGDGDIAERLRIPQRSAFRVRAEQLHLPANLNAAKERLAS